MSPTVGVAASMGACVSPTMSVPAAQVMLGTTVSMVCSFTDYVNVYLITSFVESFFHDNEENMFLHPMMIIIPSA